MTRGDVPYQILKRTKNSTTKAVWDSRRKLTNDKEKKGGEQATWMFTM